MDTAPLTPAALAVAALTADLAKAIETFASELYRSGNLEMAELVRATAGIERQAKALHLKAVGEFDARGIARDAGDINTAAWLRSALNQTPHAARTSVKLAKAVATNRHALTGEALAAGRIEYEQLRVTVETIDKLPADCTPEQVDFSRDLLLDTARQHHAGDLRRLGRIILDRADPDGPEPEPDKRVDQVKGVTFNEHGDGTMSVHYRDGIEHLAKVRAALAALDKPLDAKDPRSTPQRRADAMRLIFDKFLRSGDLPHARGEAPHITLVVGLDTLKGLDSAAYGALATGSALTPAAVARLGCDANITPIVLDPKGRPLSVGRTYRIFPAHIFKALVARDGGCVGPACDAPPWLCRAHHITWWEHDGDTALDDGALLCDTHHTWVHHRGWDIRLDQHGIPEMIPPEHIDPERKPRKNFYWQAQRGLLIPPEFPSTE